LEGGAPMIQWACDLRGSARVRPPSPFGSLYFAVAFEEKIGMDVFSECPFGYASSPNEAAVRQRCRDVVVAVKEFANCRSFFGEVHPEPHRPGLRWLVGSIFMIILRVVSGMGERAARMISPDAPFRSF
jgi:hypothetical protein